MSAFFVLKKSEVEMSGITLEQAVEKLDLWMRADEAVASGQSFTYKQRSYTQADAAVIQERIEYWDAKVKKLSRGGVRVSRIIPE